MSPGRVAADKFFSLKEAHPTHLARADRLGKSQVKVLAEPSPELHVSTNARDNLSRRCGCENAASEVRSTGAEAAYKTEELNRYTGTAKGRTAKERCGLE